MEPTPQQARELVGAVERSTAHVRTEGRWYVAFLGGLGLVVAAPPWIGAYVEARGPDIDGTAR